MDNVDCYVFIPLAAHSVGSRQQQLCVLTCLSIHACIHTCMHSVFTPASESEVYKILSNCPNKQSDSDPIPTWLLKECSSLLVPTITNIVNLSLISGQFHPILKESIISPLLKKPTLDKEVLSNYRPISDLSLISKIIVLSNPVSWITLLPTVYSILTSQPTANITPPKQLICTSMITSSVQWDHRKYHASAYSTSLLLSTLLTMTS